MIGEEGPGEEGLGEEGLGDAGPGRPVLVLDQRGRRCPLPVIELARRIGEVAVGGILSVIADDAAAALDIPAWCRMRGQEYLGESRAEDGTPAYAVRRTR